MWIGKFSKCHKEYDKIHNESPFEMFHKDSTLMTIAKIITF